MVRLTSIERDVFNILQSLGFEVKEQFANTDPANTFYVQWKVEIAGKKPFVIDFALPHAQIGIEVDGEYWHNGAVHKVEDQLRDKKLRSLGWKILRISDQRIDKQHIQNSIWLLLDV